MRLCSFLKPRALLEIVDIGFGVNWGLVMCWMVPLCSSVVVGDYPRVVFQCCGGG